jgi:protein-S-isoprenylcysteine O-methyltransferase Ste14
LAEQALKKIRHTKLYDLCAAAPLIAWYGYWAAHMLPSVTQEIALIKVFIQTDASVLPATLVLRTLAHISTLVFLALLVVAFVVRQVPQRTAPGFYPRFVAVAGTYLGTVIVMLPPQELSSELYLISLLMIISGTVVAISAVLALGRSISILPEARRLVTWGPYALVRHPLYLGEIIAIFGIALQYLLPWALLLAALVCALQFLRMKNEERILVKVFPEYENYMVATARLMPGLY